MNDNSKKKTISTLLSIALLLSATCGLLKETPFIMPEEISLESLIEAKGMNGKRKQLLPLKNM